MFLSARRHFGNFLILLIPSSWFGLKRVVLRFMKIQLGRDVKVNVGVRFYGDGPIRIGDYSWISPNCIFYTAAGWGVEIGENCDIAPEVCFVCGSHEIASSSRRAGKGKSGPIVVGNGVWVCARSTVLSATIEDGSVVAASSLVNKDVQRNALVGGVPARVIRTLE